MNQQAATESVSASNSSADREEALDSARGLAALTVVASHMVCEHMLPPVLHPLVDTPLRALWNGEAAVMFFFILSGYVLALPFMKPGREIPSIAVFTVRRVFRIYPAFLCVLLLSVGAQWIGWAAPKRVLYSPGTWAPGWAEPSGPLRVLREALLVWRDGSHRIIPPDWTLWIEVVFSLWIPVLAVLCRKQLPGFLLLLVVAIWGMGTSALLLHFCLGVFIVRIRDPWRVWWKSANLALRIVIPVIAAYLYTWRTSLNPATGAMFKQFLGDPQVAGAAVFMLVLIASHRLRQVLEWRPLVIVGRLSYGVYLVHTLVILGLLPWVLAGAAAAGITDPTALWFTGLLAAVVLSLALAWPVWRWVEMPGNALGKRLASALTARLNAGPHVPGHGTVHLPAACPSPSDPSALRGTSVLPDSA